MMNAMLMQQGELRAYRDDPWMPFTATEHFSVHPIAFRWLAWVRQSAFVRVRVSDRYENGHGDSSAKLFGVVTVASQRASPEVNQASLVRYLAESPWLPPFFADARLEWQELNTSTVRATLRDRLVTAAVDITFGANGEIERVETQRYRDVHGKPVLTPWHGYFEDYEPMEGLVIPRSARVEWAPLGDAFEVWRGRIVDAKYSMR
jgi:hypothetical protein